jgi:hypothetical protein
VAVKPRRRSVLYAYVASGNDDAGRSLSLTFVDDGGRVQQLITLTPVGTRTPCERALRGIVHALWTARTLGYRRVIVHSDQPEAVAQINGARRVDPGLIGPYLEARALMHAYRWARVTVGEIRWERLGVGLPQQQQLSALERRSDRAAGPLAAAIGPR